jgi:hypothetical protein
MAVAAEDVQFVGTGTGSKRLNITGVFDNVRCPGTPCTLEQIAVVVGFSASPTEFEHQRKVRVYLLDPDGEQIRGLQNTCIVPKAPRAGSRSFFHLLFPFRDVRFSRYGPHTFSVSVGEDHKADVPIYISE